MVTQDATPLRPGHDRLRPRVSHLSNVRVVLHSWKKSHEYIRTRNWYSDPLELDVSSVMLRSHVRDWAKVLRSNQPAIEPDPTRIVLAPKTSRWKFENGLWAPEDKHLDLRPLAHLSIRDQTFMSAAMLCLADAVETEQGDPDPTPGRSVTNLCSSFGNRLYSDYEGDKARFHWGSSTAYRKYFVDYQSFLDRPTQILSRLPSKPGREVFVVSADLSKCYDRVNRERLLNKIADVVARSSESADTTEESTIFVSSMRSMLKWRIHPDDVALVEEYVDVSSRGLGAAEELVKRHVQGVPTLHLPSPLTSGIPQGLVAGGFLANVYLLEFDAAIKRALRNQAIPELPEIVLHDYVRYVDDMRFVVSTDGGYADEDEIRWKLYTWIQQLLSRFAPGQVLNPMKFELNRHGQPAVRLRVGETMQRVQTTLSGPIDIVDGQELLSVLAGLLLIGDDDAESPVPASAEGREGEQPLPKELQPVADLYVGKMDVRRDTLERFAANRWRTVFRQIRIIAEDDSGGAEVGVQSLEPGRLVLDRQAHAFSRYLIRQWIGDPSRVLLLRIALDLYPSTEFLDPTISLLRSHLPGIAADSESEGPEERVAQYVSAELFRAGATETGFVNDPDELPSESRIEGYRERLSQFALEVFRARARLPWYLVEQAALFLATTDNRVSLSETGLEPGMPPLLHRFLQLRGGDIPDLNFSRDTWESDYALLVVAYKVGSKENRVVTVLNRILDSAGADIDNLLPTLLSVDPALLSLWWNSLDPQRRARFRGIPDLLGIVDQPAGDSLFHSNRAEPIPLTAIMTRGDNPFRDEVAALRLLQALVREWPTTTTLAPGGAAGFLDPRRIDVSCPDWSRIGDPRLPWTPEWFRASIRPEVLPRDPRYEPEAQDSLPERWQEDLARVVRAAIVGRQDFTEFAAYPASDPTQGSRYFGIRSSWYKRKHGLFFGREGLGEPYIPVTDWLTHLLASLLGWGAKRDVGAPEITLSDLSQDGLTRLIDRRSRELVDLRGEAADLQMFRFPVRSAGTAGTADRPCVVALVPTAYPPIEAFEHDVGLVNASTRRRHRRHIRALVRLVYATVSARHTFMSPPVAGVDFVFLPELSVHEDDLKIIHRLIWKLHCGVFVGRIYRPHPFLLGKWINTAAWLIPDFAGGTRRIQTLEQGKQHPTSDEERLGVVPFRPCQWIVEEVVSPQDTWRLTGSVCLDATDLRLAADLRNRIDTFVVAALNKDIHTFDTMVSSLNYHMYSHVVLVNSGLYGGTTVQAPYSDPSKRIIIHNHGPEQTPVAIAMLHPLDFRSANRAKAEASGRKTKSPPAGITK